MIELTEEICRDLPAASSREWLETNGLGGFASSTICGMNTRRYHGLLIAATKPPVGRVVMLAKLEETLVVDERRCELSANQYPGAVHPQGYQFLTHFRLDPFPIFTFQVDDIEIEKSVFMIQGENSTVVQYQFRRNGAIDAAGAQMARLSFEIRPLIAFRDYHAMAHENNALDPAYSAEAGMVGIRPYNDKPTLFLGHSGGVVEPAGYWYRNFEHALEQERGFTEREDLFKPFLLKFDLAGSARVDLVASTERRGAVHADEYRAAEITRRGTVVARAHFSDEFGQQLAAAADQFIVARGDGKTIIAGYHWFSDWGRDTMIALPGLTLATGRPEIAGSILLEFAKHVDLGMLPNRFPEAGETPEYNTVDAALWFFEAVRAYWRHTGDDGLVRNELYPVLAEIIDWHRRGTRYGIKVDADGLLYSGEPGMQLTWMDAKVGDWVVTPRTGKPVEIQALWYNALRIMEELAVALGEPDGVELYRGLAEQAYASFNAQFWNAADGCLYDVVNGDFRDVSLRPNQIFAVSLPHSILAADKAQAVVNAVERELLTRRGLRSLAKRNPQYRGRYVGDSRARDGAYHQGTVWAWLMGPFITAYLKVHGNAGRERAAELLAGFQTHLSEAGLGQVSEIFDGDAPHAPRGCIAQAWSVSELLRVEMEMAATASGQIEKTRSDLGRG